MSLFYRACWLAAIFIPFMILAFPLYFISTLLSAYRKEYLQCTVWVMLRYCLERGGAAFIKWGQWSLTREDLFPDSLCRILGRLHDQAHMILLRPGFARKLVSMPQVAIPQKDHAHRDGRGDASTLQQPVAAGPVPAICEHYYSISYKELQSGEMLTPSAGRNHMKIF